MNEFFKSEAHKVVFGLMYLDSKARMDVLGITMAVMSSRKQSKSWYDRTKSILEDAGMATDEVMEKLEFVYIQFK